MSRPNLRIIVPALLTGFAAMAMPAVGASDHSTGDGSSANNDRLLPGLYPATPGTMVLDYEPADYDPFFNVDWSVGLRGSYTEDNDGAHQQVIFAPRGTLSHEGRRSAILIEGDAEIGLPVDGRALHLRSIGLSATGGYAIDSVTNLVTRGTLEFDRPDPDEPGLAPDIAIPGDVRSAAFGVEVDRQMGLFNIAASGAVERRVFGPTMLRDGVIRPNDDQDVLSLDGGLRVGYQVTPIFEVFGLGEAGRDIFDTASTTLGIKGDATDYAFSAGVLGQWSSILEAEVSVGAGVRRFDAASIDAINTTLFNARLTFTPDETLSVTAELASAVEPPGIDDAGLARIATEASASLDYTVNSWLRLRANADWYTASFVGSPATESGRGVGFGADYVVNAHTQLSADYAFDQVERSGVAPEDTHRVTVGITLSR